MALSMLQPQLQLWTAVLVLSTCSWVNVLAEQDISTAAAKDRAALLELKSKITEFGSSNVAQWDAEGHPCLPEAWPHLACTGDRVTELDLSDSDIAGSLTDGLGRMTKLARLDLGGNSFTGGLPEDWASKRAFKKLTFMSLRENELSGELPSWDKVGAFKSLETLDLANNAFYGGLQPGWLSSTSKFRRLATLDLSHNFLGYKDEGRTLLEGPEAWCPSSDSSQGWCSSDSGPPANLETLDLSYNGLNGLLPAAWARLFTTLRTLYLQGNNFTAKPDGSSTPAALLPAWTSEGAFPKLSVLYLYPGNSLICSLPDYSEDEMGTFQGVNRDSTFRVVDEREADSEVTSDNPHLCPAPTKDNPPSLTALSVDAATQTVSITWSAPKEAAPVYGYKVGLAYFDPAQEEWADVYGDWTGRLFRTFLDDDYTSLAHGMRQLPTKSGAAEGVSEGEFALDLGYRGRTGKYYVEVASYNFDGEMSTADSLQGQLEFSEVSSGRPCTEEPKGCVLLCQPGAKECEFVRPGGGGLAGGPPRKDPAGVLGRTQDAKPMPDKCRTAASPCVLKCYQDNTCEWVVQR